MNPDQFGVYTNPNGQRYFILADQSIVNLSYYNPANGDYAEVGDNTVYNNAGEDTGQIFNGTAVVAGPTTGGATWLDVLNSGIGAAGSIFGHNNTPAAGTTGTYMPIPATTPPPSTTGTVLKVLGVLAILGVIVVVVVKSGKKGKPAQPAK